LCRRPRPAEAKASSRAPRDAEGRRDQGRSRRDQEEDRIGWRQGRDQVNLPLPERPDLKHKATPRGVALLFLHVAKWGRRPAAGS
jgi:hypothetical protein